MLRYREAPVHCARVGRVERERERERENESLSFSPPAAFSAGGERGGGHRKRTE